MISEYFYGRPYQVIFLRKGNGAPFYEKGIAFRDSIIAARDGAEFSTKSVLQLARECGVDEDYAIVESVEWLPFFID